MQVPSGTPGEEVALFRVEAVEKGAALEEGEVAGIGQEFQLLVEDIMEEVEVVAANEEPEQVSSEERERKLEEQGQEHPRPGALSDRPPMEALAALQVELDPVNKKAQRAHPRLKDKNCQRRKLHLEHRSAIIQGIRGFWVKVVEDLRHPTVCCKITAAGYRSSHSSPIQWYQGFERKAYSHRHHHSSVNFFNWFFDHNFTGSGMIAEVGSHWVSGPELAVDVGVLGSTPEGPGSGQPCADLAHSLADHH
ncbi:hypothetical protein Celaphus_00019617 [Cervus elaphus hippelaphus]|uniref:Testis-specific Y-encoded protein 1-like n=1 Tax=Cervus elaphus hippelaphus TaxID=46360 RepID=A0A212BZ68_CEREH|nr:hypothetical protein Celaphus_00019617 [Cervus elaphus hippelaphus]